METRLSISSDNKILAAYIVAPFTLAFIVRAVSADYSVSFSLWMNETYGILDLLSRFDSGPSVRPYLALCYSGFFPLAFAYSWRNIKFKKGIGFRGYAFLALVCPFLCAFFALFLFANWPDGAAQDSGSRRAGLVQALAYSQIVFAIFIAIVVFSMAFFSCGTVKTFLKIFGLSR